MRTKTATQQTTNNPSELVKSELVKSDLLQKPVVAPLRIHVTNIRRSNAEWNKWVVTMPDGMQKVLTEAVIEDLTFNSVVQHHGCGSSSDFKGHASGYLVSESVKDVTGEPIKFCRDEGYFYTGDESFDNEISKASKLILKDGKGYVTK